jgi:hypothetical protein
MPRLDPGFIAGDERIVLHELYALSNERSDVSRRGTCLRLQVLSLGESDIVGRQVKGFALYASSMFYGFLCSMRHTSMRDQHGQISPRLRCQMGARASDLFCHSNSFKPFLQSLFTHGPRVTLAADFKIRDSAVVARARKQAPTGSGKSRYCSGGTSGAGTDGPWRGAVRQLVTGPLARESMSLHRHLYGKAKGVSLR